MQGKSRKTVLELNRRLSWIILLLSVLMLATGYLQTRFPINRAFWTPLHTTLGVLFLILLIIHFAISITLLRFPWRTSIKKIIKQDAGTWTKIRTIQRASAWLLLIFSIVMLVSGLGWYSFNLWKTIPFHPHVRYDTLYAITLIIHTISGLKIAIYRNKINIPSHNTILLLLCLAAILSIFYIENYEGALDKESDETDPPNDPLTEPGETLPLKTGKVIIGTENYSFDPSEVETLRSDIFQPGYFSMFDVLAHLSEKGEVQLNYHFDDEMNTHIIDELQGEKNWWYYTYYDGGWRESNYFRPDHYPWKDGTTLVFHQVPESRLEQTYSIYREEHERLAENGGKIVVPQVSINGKKVNEEFLDVLVTPHNLRNDIFQDGVITAIDVILSLGDQGKIDYKLQWYESIGTARIVKNYWVESIGEDVARGRCGFVYESGDLDIRGFAGNHIHLPSDSRVLNSPEYVLYFWICI